MTSAKAFDFFISHASEDKKTVALPIRDGLTARGHRVWLDAGELAVGDSLFKKINDGLHRSRYGVVILSPAFLIKDWPTWELEALIAIENAERRKVILPVWHRMSLVDVAAVAPLLAGRIAANTSTGIEAVVADLAAALETGGQDLSPASLLDTGIVEIEEVFEREPLDFYAEAEEAQEVSREATRRIVEAMQTFTADARAYTANLQARSADLRAGRSMKSRDVRSTLNQIVPAFRTYSVALDQNVTAMGEAHRTALLQMTRGLVLDREKSSDQRGRWLGVLSAIQNSAQESKAVAEEGLTLLNNLPTPTVSLKHARRDLAQKIERFLAAHDRAIGGIQNARELLSPIV